MANTVVGETTGVPGMYVEGSTNITLLEPQRGGINRCQIAGPTRNGSNGFEGVIDNTGKKKENKTNFTNDGEECKNANDGKENESDNINGGMEVTNIPGLARKNVPPKHVKTSGVANKEVSRSTGVPPAACHIKKKHATVVIMVDYVGSGAMNEDGRNLHVHNRPLKPSSEVVSSNLAPANRSS